MSMLVWMIASVIISLLYFKLGDEFAWKLTNSDPAPADTEIPRSPLNKMDKKGYTADDFLVTVNKIWRETDLDWFINELNSSEGSDD